jgi:hypothetical protein
MLLQASGGCEDMLGGGTIVALELSPVAMVRLRSVRVHGENGSGESRRVRREKQRASGEVDRLLCCSVLPNVRGGEDARQRSGGVTLAWSPHT